MTSSEAATEPKGEGTRGAPLATPVEQLLGSSKGALACDVLIVGSGYGGSIAALELAGVGKVWVFERGREYALGEFPETIGELPGHVQFARPGDKKPIGRSDALFDLRLGKDMSVLVGSGLGGTSLINANVAAEPSDSVLADQRWPQSLREDLKNLKGSFKEVRRLVGAAAFPGAKQLPKYAALERLAKSCGAEPKPAEIAVTTQEKPNAVGVSQAACVKCGNCITGCNFGAKNTLNLNVIPLARTRGCKFFTGATAVSVRAFDPSCAQAQAPDEKELRWTVRFARTQTLKTPGFPDRFDVHARTVILAAGTLGSVEILSRSAEKHGLLFSKLLGRRFTGNGDFFAFGYAQKTPVNAVAGADVAGDPNADLPGPTITGIVTVPGTTGGDRDTTILEDGATPTALASLIGSLLATGSLPHRYVKCGQPSWFKMNRKLDTLSVQLGALRNSQVVLGMARDDGDGQLRFREGRVHLEWPKVGSQTAYRNTHALLSHASEQGGFDGGDYIPNPAWKPIPDGFSELLGSPDTGSLVTVHPLGGCVMGESVESGVVDDVGNVFRRNLAEEGDCAAGKRHEGLFVLDGSIIPCPLGVNPFLTIAGVAMRAARLICEQLEVPLRQFGQQASVAPEWKDPWRTRTRKKLEPAHVELEFSELLMSKDPVIIPQSWVGTFPKYVAPYLAQRCGLVARVTTHSLNPWRWMQSPQDKLSARIDLYCQPVPDIETIPAEHIGRPIGPGRDDFEFGVPFASLEGKVQLLSMDAPSNGLITLWRTIEAIATFFGRRGRDFTKNMFSKSPDPKVGPIAHFWRGFIGFLRAGRNHTTWRRLVYKFGLGDPRGQPQTLKLTGEKVLAYAPHRKNPWDALTQLDFWLEMPSSNEAVHGRLDVDILDLVKRRRLQVVEAPDTPTAIAALIGFGLLWLRALITTHYWSFRGLDYEDFVYKGPEPVDSPIRLPDGEQVDPQVYALDVPRSCDSGETIGLKLSRYSKGQAQAKPILLVHGLAHGGSIFTTATVDCNLAAYLVQRDYDVWVLDHRLSNRLGDLPRESCSLDDIAEFDIPAALAYVYGRYKAPIAVIAHCIGAAATSMAILKGNAQDQRGESMIRALALHGVHPWVVPSIKNRFSASLGAFFKDAIGNQAVDPIPPAKSTYFDQIFDRIASSLPWPVGELERHQHDLYSASAGTAVCNRMTVVYGREWKHANLDPRTHRQFGRLVGPANIDAFRHIFFLALRQRLTDKDGDNVYVTDDNVRNYWTFPTLHAHGRDNEVFSYHSAVKSKINLNALREADGRSKLAQLFVVEGVGHMDFLFAKNAHQPGSADLQAAGIFEGLYLFFEGREQREKFQAIAARLEQGEAHPHSSKRPISGMSFTHRSAAQDESTLTYSLEQSLFGTSTPAYPVLHPIRPASKSAWSDACVTDLSCFLPTVSRPRGHLKLPGQFWTIEIPVRHTGIGPVPEYAFELCYERAVPQTEELSLCTRRAQQGHPVAPETHLPRTWLNCAPWFYRLQRDSEGNAGWSFLAVSCRWPGTPFDRDAVDQLYEAMTEQAKCLDIGIDGVWLLGDQIYADATADVVKLHQRAEAFAARYRDATSGGSLGEECFSGANLEKLLSATPSWMVVDDHEFSDDWPGISEDADGNTTLLNGFKAALGYQWRTTTADGAAAPALLNVDDPRNLVVARGLWRSTSIRGLPVFLADTRTERQFRRQEDWKQMTIMSANQQQALRDWLLKTHEEDPEKPKFILCGSVLGLVTREQQLFPETCINADGWIGYPKSIEEVTRFTFDNKVKNVYFVSGDPHFSAVSALSPTNDGCSPLMIHSIIASGANATVPFANAKFRDQVFGRWIPMPNTGIHAIGYPMSDAPRQFSRIEILRENGAWSVVVKVFDGHGKQSGDPMHATDTGWV